MSRQPSLTAVDLKGRLWHQHEVSQQQLRPVFDPNRSSHLLREACSRDGNCADQHDERPRRI